MLLEVGLSRRVRPLPGGGPPPAADLTVSIIAGPQYRVTDHTNGDATEDFPTANGAIERAIDLAASGESIFIEAGTYPIGQTTAYLDATASDWTATFGGVSIEAGALTIGGQTAVGETATVQFNFSSNPSAGTIFAHVDFDTPFTLADVGTLCYWNATPVGPTTGPFEIRFYSGLGATGTLVASSSNGHPEPTHANEFKNSRLPLTGGVGATFGSNGTTIRSMALAWTGTNAPSAPWTLTMGGKVRGQLRSSVLNFGSNVEIFGDRINTILRCGDFLSSPMISIGSSANINVHDLHLDGNLDNNWCTDFVPAIYSPASSALNRVFHHLWIHDFQGSGMQIRGNNVEAYENYIDHVINAGLQTTAQAVSGLYFHHNTIKNSGNDGQLWLFGGQGTLVEYNLLEGQTPLCAKDGATNNTFQFNRCDAQGSSFCFQLEDNAGGVQTIHNNELIGHSSAAMVYFGTTKTTVHSVTNNWIHSPSNPAADGIRWSGNNSDLSDNETDDHDGSGANGIEVTGSNNTGTGNWCPDGFSGGGQVSQGAGPPNINKGFVAGASWSPE